MTDSLVPTPTQPNALAEEPPSRSGDVAGGRKAVSAVVRVCCGNLVEMFDFFLFGLYATDIARTFFPASSEYASLLLTFATFGAGFLMRPLGALILGAYIDRAGRRAGLLFTLGLMAAGTVMLAATPGYAVIGWLAPAIVLVGRLLQGLSAGAEVGGVSVYLAEISPPGRKGFYVAWQSASQQAAIMMAALLGYAINSHFTKVDVEGWAWRLPFGVGCLIVPALFYIRAGLQETLPRRPAADSAGLPDALRSVASSWRVVLIGMLLVVMTTASFYLITVYTPTYGRKVLHLTAGDALLVTFCVGLSNFIWLPLSGAVSDRIGRAPIMVVCTALTLLSAYPALAWLVATPSFSRMLIVELWLSALYAAYNGAALPAIAELVPAHARATGFSLAYSLATALAGGFTPMVATWLISATGNKASPGWWLAAAASCGLAATFGYRRLAASQPTR